MINKVEHLSLQQQIESLTIILEHWLPVLEQMELIKNNLSDLPRELENIQQNLNDRNRKKFKHKNKESLENINVNKEVNEQKILNSKLENILASLEAETPRLMLLEENINNLICLREVIEALQERIKIQSITNYSAEFQSIKNNKQNPEQNKRFKYLRHSWQNLGHQTKFNRRMKLVFVFGLLLSWNLLSNFIYHQTVNQDIDNQVTNMEETLENFKEDRPSDSIEKK